MKKLVCLLLAWTMLLCCAGSALAEPAESTLFTLGTVIGSSYENATLGYGCTLEGWTFAGNEDIAMLNQWQADLTGDLQELIAQADTFMDMYAESGDGLSNINIQFQNMNLLYGALLTEEIVVDASLPQLAPMLEQIGYEDLLAEKITIMLGGDAHTGIALTGRISGVPVYQKEVCILCGRYMGIITVTSLLTDETDSILSMFHAL